MPFVEATAEKVEVLSYSATLTNPYTGVTGSYKAEFSCSAVPHNIPQNWTIVSYTWTPTVPFPQGQMPSAFQLTFPFPGTGQSLTGTAYTAAIHTATVTMRLRDDLGLYHYYTDDVNVAAIGGALSLSVWDAELPTWNRDLNQSNKPVYLQYFQHNPLQPPGSLSQRPQKGRFVPALSQPEGTTFTNSVTGSHVAIYNSGGRMDFASTASSGTGGYVPKITFSLTFETGSDTGDDCSSQMPDPETYKFTSHLPADLQCALFSQGPWSNAQWPYGWERADSLHLRDHLDQPMPGVFVQERFDPSTPTPPNFWTANAIYLWQTILNPPGNANAYDVFRYGNPTPYLYQNYPNFPLLHLMQEYWAGTRDPNYGSTNSGVFVGKWDIFYWTDRIDHFQQPPPP